MIDNEIFKYYEIIGQINTAVSSASNFDEAIHNGVKLIVDVCDIDYAIVWYEDVKGDSILHPYYWICPIDCSSLYHKRNEGSVGRVYVNQKAERYLNYKKNDDEISQKDFENIDIGSMVVVPLSNKHDILGCIQFINSKGKYITQENADMCEILSSLIAIKIDEQEKFSRENRNNKTIIKVRNVEKEFINGDTKTKVLKGVNLDVYEGEFLVIVGESGCGKSTLLNIISGLDQPDSGEFYFENNNMIGATQRQLTEYRRENIGFIFQSYYLMPNLNSKQNLDLIGELVQNPIDSLEALKMVGLENKKNNYPSQLSGGQQQRVSIARSLVKKPKIIMADEPTAALDYDTSINILKILESITKNGTTLIVVTHNDEIAKMANRVVKIRNGRVYETYINRYPLRAEELVW